MTANIPSQDHYTQEVKKNTSQAKQVQIFSANTFFQTAVR